MITDDKRLKLNIYSPNTSTTSTKVPCISSMYEYRSGCSEAPGKCPYQVQYLSNNTSSTGVLVEDVLHLTTEDNQPKVVDARITFGCGQAQTGSFLDGAAPNGLFGLEMEKLSVPSILSSAGFTANSFSMCFGYDGTGRISFGDKGSSLDLKETLFSVNNLSEFFLFRAFVIFNSQAQDKRRPSDSRIPFEFCYDIRWEQVPVLDPAALVSDEVKSILLL
ncbi:hypothetical protein GIB67_027387 [Kingdonia uniflora]|uniref:Xylanase inhibitor N-terminal domain-containing protein n=1 Tax=Kingdonia uniflora TaxID=39325 RepID=A0A7J7MFF3_9MAGN|nr:hypothetical protein GIB67_027387 [Kingdonia uniflora]